MVFGSHCTNEACFGEAAFGANDIGPRAEIGITVHRQARLDFVDIMHAHQPARKPGGSTSGYLFFEDDDLTHTCLYKVKRDAGSVDSRTNYDDIRSFMHVRNPLSVTHRRAHGLI